MAVGLRFSTTNARRQFAGSRQFFASTSASASSRTGTAARPSRSSELDTRDRVNPSGSQDPPVDPPIPESPTSKLFSFPAKKTAGKRPGVKPPPTLALPPSMHPPPPRVSHPASTRKGTKAGAPEKTYDIYLKSLNATYTEPTFADLDALRPPPSTLRAALDGVIGSGRSLLPEGHALHLAVEQLGAQEASVGGGPGAKKTVIAGSKKARKLEYVALYEATERLVAGGFTLPQLRRLEKESRLEAGVARLELPAEKSSSKQKIIHRIMSSRWNMIHPAVIKEYLAEENATSEQDYPVSPSELFIFLGRDGENLLHLAKELKMNITVDREQTSADLKQASTSGKAPSRPGFIIHASGAAGNHKRLKRHLEEQRSLMTVRMVVLPIGPLLSPALLQSISRISGAFVENVHAKFAELEENENSVASVLITARNPRSAYTAERLVQRAAMEDAHRFQIPLFSLTRSDTVGVDILDAAESPDAHGNDAKYALYPFGTHGFRIQQVQDGSELPTDAQGQGRVVDSDEAFILTGKERPSDDAKTVPTNLKGEAMDLRKFIFGDAEGLSEVGKAKITATYGHIAFKAASSPALISPLPNPASRKSVLEWTDKQEAKSRTFIPGQVPLVARSVPDKIISIHRLQYRTIEGGHVVDVRVELPSDNVEHATIEHEARSNAQPTNTADPTDRLELTSDNYLEGDGEATMVDEDRHESSIRDEAEPNAAEAQDEADASPSSPGDSQATESVESATPAEATDEPTQEPTPLPTEITVGTETALELLVPDSTMDIYLQVSNVSPLARSYVPDSLTTYLNELSIFFTTDIDAPQPDPPQRLSIDGKDYMLVKNTSSRYGLEPSITELPSGCVVATEMSLDLENNSRAAFTQLVYDGTGGTEGWDGFMRACQSLASKPYEQSSELRVNPT